MRKSDKEPEIMQANGDDSFITSHSWDWDNSSDDSGFVKVSDVIPEVLSEGKWFEECSEIYKPTIEQLISCTNHNFRFDFIGNGAFKLIPPTDIFRVDE